MGSEEGAQSYTVNTPGAPGHATGVPALHCQIVCKAGLALLWGWFPRDKGKIDEAKWWELACDPALLALVSEEGWLAWHDEN